MADGRMLVRCVDSRDALLPATVQQPAALPRAEMPVSAPVQTQARTGHYVQIATFGVPANTVRTTSRLQAHGLTVRVQPVRSHGRALEVVLAGPFADAAAAHAALRIARGMGFGDAFFRN